ncbi:MAG: FkbM family methyltransferase [Bacteroidetes bacterium]|nr:FkbM family methyltransferase [Bacteroidota bacterium]
MAVSGVQRYFKLLQNVSNPWNYWQDKISPSSEITFTTRPNHIMVRVPKRLMLIFKEIFLSDVYNISDLKKNLSENSIVVDIGANVGFFSMLVLSKVKVKKILAFEPIPSNLEIFQRTISDNQIVKDSLVLTQAAVTGNPQPHLELHLDGNNELTENASVFSGFESTHSVKITVPSITFNEIIQKHQLEQIDFLKMDCEGSEFDIIYNTDSSLLKRIKRMMVEVHDIEGDEKNNVNYFNNYLRSLGFTTSFERLSKRSHVLIAHR